MRTGPPATHLHEALNPRASLRARKKAFFGNRSRGYVAGDHVERTFVSLDAQVPEQEPDIGFVLELGTQAPKRNARHFIASKYLAAP